MTTIQERLSPFCYRLSVHDNACRASHRSRGANLRRMPALRKHKQAPASSARPSSTSVPGASCSSARAPEPGGKLQAGSCSGWLCSGCVSLPTCDPLFLCTPSTGSGFHVLLPVLARPGGPLKLTPSSSGTGSLPWGSQAWRTLRFPQKRNSARKTKPAAATLSQGQSSRHRKPQRSCIAKN